MNSKRAMAQLLRHLQSAGLTHVPKVELPKARPPGAAPAAKGMVAEKATGAEGSGTDRRPSPKPRPTSPVSEIRRPSDLLGANDVQLDGVRKPESLPSVQALLQQSRNNRAEREQALCALKDIVAGCKRCTELSSRRTQTVFGVGNPEARIMFIGEAPGADEDAQGEPFVGAAGQLLNKIIGAMTLKREDLYICNILRCRPPGNRNPLPQEAANCREFLDAQIKVIQPEYIVCWGTVAAQNLLNETAAVGKMRQKFFEYAGAKVVCTYHPSYLLRNPSAKKLVWEDMKFFMKELGVDLQ
ncbi:MAG: uracil-DNA glycosylase [Planctomycetaceae bacterium]